MMSIKKILCAAMVFSIATTSFAQSTEQLLLSGWRFQKGACEGAQKADFDDSSWQKVSVPHDWAISGPFDKNIDIQVVAIEQNGEREASEKTGRSGSLPWIGEGWYRTRINIPDGYSYGELIFDGAMSEPHVWVDGHDIGYWAYGYNTFNLDLTKDALKPGLHTVAVHLQNVEESSRWYPGAGLYRPVRLVLHKDVFFKTWATFARTSMVSGVSEDATKASDARLYVTTEIDGNKALANGKKLQVAHKLLSSDGTCVATATSEISSLTNAQVLILKNADLWSPEHPALYTLVSELREPDGTLWDTQQTKVGIRSIEYSSEGFKLNGQLRKFKGVCLHHDLGPLGAAFNKAAFRRQVALLKDMGCDAIRTSHNMPAPWQMDICDEMGMMVMAESCDMWVSNKVKNGYSKFFEQVDNSSANKTGEPWWKRDFTNLVLVHRNHPSIIMWSIGNEIPDQGDAIGLKYTRLIQNLIHELDETRPCTQGMDRGTAPMWSGVWQETDIPGFNYRLHVYQKGLENSPSGIVLGSETASTVSSRGVYKFPAKLYYSKEYDDMQCSSYDIEASSWSNTPDEDWMWQDKAPWVIGEFVWTGFDYLGEPTPYDNYWPSRSSYFGIFDLAGLPKDRVWLYRTHWAPEKETLHLLPHWNWKGREGEVTPVFCYTSYPEAELFVNGKSQGRKKHIDVSMEDYLAGLSPDKTPWGDTVLHPDYNAPEGKNLFDRYRLRWTDVVYEPGEIKVVAYDATGKAVAEEVIRTAGKPHHIELSVDRSKIDKIPVDAQGNALDCPDLAFVTAKVVDKDGNICPVSDNQLSFAVKGVSAKFNSCCNGDATSLEVFTNPTMKVFNGQLVIVVEATDVEGISTLTVSGKGLKPAQTNIEVR